MSTKRVKNVTWSPWGEAKSVSFDCGYCGSHTAPPIGMKGMGVDNNGLKAHFAALYPCPSCGMITTIMNDGTQHPQPVSAPEIMGLQNDIRTLYREAVLCFANGCYNAVAMVCRKIILQIAFDTGFAGENRNEFMAAINHLIEQRHLSEEARKIADPVRDIGNRANHRIELINPANARWALHFTAFLLRQVYEQRHLHLMFDRDNRQSDIQDSQQ